jgi:hypothetical protein
LFYGLIRKQLFMVQDKRLFLLSNLQITSYYHGKIILLVDK